MLAEAVSKNGAGESQEFSMPGASAVPWEDYGGDYDYVSEPLEPSATDYSSTNDPDDYDYHSVASNGRDVDYSDYGGGNQDYSDQDYSDYGDYGGRGAGKRSAGDNGVSPLILGIVAGVSLLSLLVAVGGVCWMCAVRRRRNRGPPSHGLPAFTGPLKRNVVDAEKAREGPGVSQPIAAGGGAGGLMNFFSRRRGNLNSVTAAPSGPNSLPRGGAEARLVGRQDGVPIRVQVAPLEAAEDHAAPLSPSHSV